MKSGEAKLFAGILVAAIAMVAVALAPMLMARDPERPPPPPPALTGAELAPASARSQGNAQARHTLVEFGDYQCALCKTVHDRSKEWLREYGDRLRFVYYHYSASRHPLSRTMARAAEAAAEQGKYREMHNLLFENAQEMSRLSPQDGEAFIMRLAGQLQLDMLAFRAALTGPSTDQAVAAAEDLAMRAGVMSTPNFIMVLPDGTLERLPTLESVEQWLKDPTKLR
ncbi:MAG TPA: thioredoxin domain-containing protein [Chthonomonadales bacterium]|nr:thioredoxin domain-containing protein [Chthonomonadales bacterium]